MPKRYSCIVVDDERPGRDLIAAHISQLPLFELTHSCGDAIEASEVLASHQVDLLFLDIEMPALKGTDFYLSLANPPPVIFTTAYRDYAVQGFELEAVVYLIKPVVFSRFFKATQRFINLSASAADLGVSNGAQNDELFLRVDRRDVRVSRADILYVQSIGDYQQVHTSKGRLLHKATLNAFAKKLGPGFIRIHRSYLVNQSHISAITTDDVILGDIELPISGSYRKGVVSMIDGSTDDR